MIVIGIGEVAISSERTESLTTYSLGSCVALIIRCPLTGQTAMAHIVLPEANRFNHARNINEKPAYFADVIVPKIIDKFIKNAQCKRELLQILIVGGAESKEKKDVFKVGQRNVERVKNILKAYGLENIIEEVGGYYSRTVQIDLWSGDVMITTQRM